MNSAPTTFSSERMHVTAKLREHGITPTHQRVRIGEALFAKAQHVLCRTGALNGQCQSR